MMPEATTQQWVSTIREAFDLSVRDLGVPESRAERSRPTTFRRSLDQGRERWFEPLGAGAERHGCWEWVAHAREARLHRYVILQVELDGEADGDPTSGRFPARVAGAAANTVHFGSRIVRQTILRSTDTVVPFVADAVGAAAEAARGLTADDLTGTYVVPAALRREVWRERRGQRR